MLTYPNLLNVEYFQFFIKKDSFLNAWVYTLVANIMQMSVNLRCWSFFNHANTSMHLFLN